MMQALEELNKFVDDSDPDVGCAKSMDEKEL